jgi:hypothetical protein
MREIRPLTEITKTIRAELKKQFPGCKFSVTTKHGIEITVALMTAPASPFANLNTVNGHEHNGEYAQLNHYHIKQDWDGSWVSNGYYLTEQAVEMLNTVIEISNRENWDNSDIQADHFDVNYYFHLEIGKWNRPFVVKGKGK